MLRQVGHHVKDGIDEQWAWRHDVNRITKPSPKVHASDVHIFRACIGCQTCGRRLVDWVGGRPYARADLTIVYDKGCRVLGYVCGECCSNVFVEPVE